MWKYVIDWWNVYKAFMNDLLIKKKKSPYIWPKIITKQYNSEYFWMKRTGNIKKFQIHEVKSFVPFTIPSIKLRQLIIINKHIVKSFTYMKFKFNSPVLFPFHGSYPSNEIIPTN